MNVHFLTNNLDVMFLIISGAEKTSAIFAFSHDCPLRCLWSCAIYKILADGSRTCCVPLRIQNGNTLLARDLVRLGLSYGKEDRVIGKSSCVESFLHLLPV